MQYKYVKIFVYRYNNMDMIRFYYYTSVPILTCSTLFYAMTTLSASITNSQNVVNFIYEHKDCDSVIFRRELETCDLQNKLNIVESLIFDVIKRYCNSESEFEEIKNTIKNPIIEVNDTTDFAMIELTASPVILNRIDEPIRYAILSTSETVKNINIIIEKIQNKIIDYKNGYLNKLMTICLKIEIGSLKHQIGLLDKRLYLLLELLKIYLPISKKV